MCFLFLDSPEELFHLLAINCLSHQDNFLLAKIQNNSSSAVSLTIYPLIPASIQPSISFIYPSFHIIFIHPSVYRSVHPSPAHLSVCPFVCPSICLYCVPMSSVSSASYQSIHLSIAQTYCSIS